MCQTSFSFRFGIILFEVKPFICWVCEADAKRGVFRVFSEQPNSYQNPSLKLFTCIIPSTSFDAINSVNICNAHSFYVCKTEEVHNINWTLWNLNLHMKFSILKLIHTWLYIFIRLHWFYNTKFHHCIVFVRDSWIFILISSISSLVICSYLNFFFDAEHPSNKV